MMRMHAKYRESELCLISYCGFVRVVTSEKSSGVFHCVCSLLVALGAQDLRRSACSTTTRKLAFL